LASLGLAGLGLAWLGLAWLGFAWLGSARLGLAWLGLAWLGLAWLGVFKGLSSRVRLVPFVITLCKEFTYFPFSINPYLANVEKMVSS
jgi:hypothetical protein